MGNYFLGVDPSTVSTGYAVVDENGELVSYGTINPENKDDHIEKLTFQWHRLKALILEYKPVSIVCEDQFQGPNVATLVKIARTSAALQIAAGEQGIPVDMMYPASWRKIFHGSGKVTKKDTLALVNERHSLNLKTKDNDIADAIGMAHACLLKWIGVCEQPKNKKKK
jgi:crossover junction endodeoxyribonuclease RuvC